MSDRLLLGFSGWPLRWPDYFPEDLPEDWQLAYYSNDADALVLSADELHAIDTEDLEEWCDDLPEYFRFYLKVDALADVSTEHTEMYSASTLAHFCCRSWLQKLTTIDLGLP